MSLTPLPQVLAALKQTHWRHQQKLEELLTLWAEIVGPVVASQTRPVKISAEQVLYVATSSSVWAQNLVFERTLILAKLNAVLTPPLVDLHFSTREWQARPVQDSTSLLPKPLQPGLQRVARRATLSRLPPQRAFERWAKAIQSQARGRPLCPRCQCPTPPLELSRWSTCALCAARAYSPFAPARQQEWPELDRSSRALNHG